MKELFNNFLRKIILLFRRKIPTQVSYTETVVSAPLSEEIKTIVGNCPDTGPNITFVKSEEELLNLYKYGSILGK